MDLHCWNEDGKHKAAILLHGAVLCDEEHDRHDKRDHPVVPELLCQGREHSLVDHTLGDMEESF